MAGGDEAAYGLFYERYCSRLLRYLLVLTRGGEEAAQEALQLTLLRVVRNIKPFRSEEVFWSWLTVLARSALVDEQRKRSRYRAFLDRFFQRNHADIAGPNHADSRLLVLLEGKLAELPEDERNLIERKYFEKKPVKDIALTSDASEKSVESKLVRIRRKLRHAILTQLNDEDAGRS